MNKSKILKIFSILVIISLVSLVAIGIVFADSVTINEKNPETFGGTYHDAFQNKGDALFKITWDDVENNYYTAGSTNDYRDYINPDTSPYCNGYCLNEDKGDGNQNFYVAAIIDIDGGDVTISSCDYTNTTMINVKSAANVAKAVYYRLKYPYKKSFVDNQNKWYVHNWMNSYGWGALYEDINNKIGDACVAPNSTDEAYSKNIVDSNEYGLKIEKDGKLTIKYGDFTFNGTQYKTKIGPYKITNYVASTAQIQVVANDGTNYPGIYNNSDSYIYIKDYVTKELKSVKITQSYESYKARLIILGTGASQARMIAYAEETEINKEDSTTDVPNLQTDISLQKYITKVTSKDGTIKYNDTTKRKNKYADTNSKLTDNSYKHQGVEISNKSGEKLNNTNNTYKSSNPVQIEAGDKVEYTIKIYNNSTVKASYVLVKDNIGNLGTMKSSYSSDTSTYKIYEGEIGAGDTITRTVEVEYNTYTDSNIMNKAWISSTKPKNKAGYRTIDADYVQMKQYSVSLEKYVTQVSDKDGNNVINVTDREGKRYNTNATNANEKNEYKKNNKVKVEPGDKVTFTIKLTNTNSSTSVKISQIYDTFTFNENEESKINGLKLIYDKEYGIQGNCEDKDYKKYNTIENDNYLINDNEKNIGRYLINFENPILLEKNSSTYVTIRFKVDVPYNLTNESQILNNIASIVKLINTNGIAVSDSDGTDNNRDQDCLATNTYAVSLEKYVASVNNINQGSCEYDARFDYNDDGKIDAIDVLILRKYFANYNSETGTSGEPLPEGKSGDYNGDGQVTSSDVVKWRRDLYDEGDDNREGYPIHNKDNNASTWNDRKYNNVVTVSNGDTVVYAIKVKNDGETKVTITNIADYFPNGVKYNGKEYTGSVYCTKFDREDLNNGQTTNKVDFSKEISLEPGESETFYVEVEVIEPNISVKVMKNVAEITGLKNRNEYPINDSTENNNKDADYIQVSHTEKEEKTEYTVKKVWKTNGNERPAQVTVKLLKVKGSEETDLGMESVVLSDENNWTYTWTDLPILDSGWKYVVRELNENGTDLLPGNGEYNDNITVTYNDNSSEKITTITNTITTSPPPDDNPEETSYSVTKVWQDDNNPDRPASVKVRLFKKNGDELVQVQKDKDGNKISDITLGSGNWSYTWNNLPKYENDKLVEYIAKEFNEKGKKVLYGKNEKNGDDFGSGYTVTYIHEADKTTIYNTKPTTETTSDDFTISGMVWNDMALNKTSSNYNGLKDKEESNLSGIEVILYRNGKGIVATTTTNENGEYRFTNANLDKSLSENERYIKGPKVAGTSRWAGTYYDYYVVFKYDGVTYTSTDNYINWTDVTNNTIDTNAKENIGKVNKNRQQFNEQFASVDGENVYDKKGNKTGKLKYSTVNEEGYVPQSIYKYDSSWMAIESSTEMIDLSNYADATIENLEKLQIQLNHINLGLKGRDVFDLELTSDVYSTKVTVNGVDGTYNYNSNKVTVRRNDCNNYNYREDSANVFYEDSYYEGNEYEQRVRESDIDVEKTNANDKKYTDTGLAIEVTYKITVKNASQTAGTAIKVSNYYDKKYTFEGAYSDSSCSNKLSDATGSSGTNYKSVVITTPGTQLNQSDTMEIYVVYTLNNPVDLLKDLDIGKKLPTYNMAEITEYTTSCGEGQTEFTRGLLDKDSAPGSVATENVRLHPDTILEETSTVAYYFGGNDLSKLKYEDDTYATPTLYFVKDSSERKITGTVFEDETITDKITKIKTGNGKLDAGEVGVYGATVQLIELPKENEENKLSSSRYSVKTDKDGKFEISGFLPGNYIIRYSYGNTVNTVLINILNNESPKINSKSYNGEDFQATNNGLNAHPDNAKYIDPKLSNLENYWYAINETDKISTGFDDSSRRLIVSNNVIESDEIMTVLNNMRDGNSKDDCKVTYTDSTSEEINNDVSDVIEKTCMWADTQQMLLTVEETIDLNGGYNMSDIEGKYKIIDKDNNIATWTIFPNEKDEHYKEYKIENMNFGIAEVPVTSIDLSKKLNKFIITDSTGQNVIASFNMDEKKGKVGFVTVADEADGRYWAQIEDEKLQGARLEITYDIRIDMNTEINFDVKRGAIPTITEIVDFIDNSLSYNENLGDNSKYWEVTLYDDNSESKDGLKQKLEAMQFTIKDEESTVPKGTVDPFPETGNKNDYKYTTIVKATKDNPLLVTEDGTATVQITLEKVLSSTNSTIEKIITSTVQSYEYSNTVEIVGIDYSNTKTGVTDETEGTRLEVMRDRVRTKDRYIILPGVQHDSATSETLVITPPTGDSSISITYYIIAVISLAVLAVGVFGIKKFVVKK